MKFFNQLLTRTYLMNFSSILSGVFAQSQETSVEREFHGFGSMALRVLLLE
jgi:hypothetical protein